MRIVTGADLLAEGEIRRQDLQSQQEPCSEVCEGINNKRVVQACAEQRLCGWGAREAGQDRERPGGGFEDDAHTQSQSL